MVAVNAVVSVVLFDQDLDQKIDLGWPGSSPGEIGPLVIFFARLLQKGAFLSSFDEKLRFWRQVASNMCIFDQF